MAHDGGNENGGQAARDFLALSHGHEWTNFYDSFDKLVQDNLARSSELLRHAMSLPEVADREVAEIKEEMATKIAAERQQAKEAFILLQKDLNSSQEQGEALQRSMSTWLADLGRLGNTINDLIQKYDAHDDAPVVEAVAPEPEPVIESVWPEPEPVVEAEAEAEIPVETAAESDAFAEVVAESSDNPGWESELSFADVVGDGTSEEAPDAVEDDPSSPQKPAWLSVARQSAAS
jgi:hypothetical protein